MSGLTGCADCDWHGPDLPPMWSAMTQGEARDLHRNFHDAARTVALTDPGAALLRGMERLNDWLATRTAS